MTTKNGRAPYAPGDLVNAMFNGGAAGTCLAMGCRVVDVQSCTDGDGWTVTVDLGTQERTYLVPSSGRSDQLEADTVANCFECSSSFTGRCQRHCLLALDDRNRDLLATAIVAMNAREGIRPGDFVILPDGTEHRVMEALRNTAGDLHYVQMGGDSFHLSQSGSVSVSGAGRPCVDPASIRVTGMTRNAPAWIWRDGRPGGDQGLDVTVSFRVFRATRRA